METKEKIELAKKCLEFVWQGFGVKEPEIEVQGDDQWFTISCGDMGISYDGTKEKPWVPETYDYFQGYFNPITGAAHPPDVDIDEHGEFKTLEDAVEKLFQVWSEQVLSSAMSDWQLWRDYEEAFAAEEENHHG